VNFEGTKNLCNELTTTKNIPDSFIFISTVAVYGMEEGDMIKESHGLFGTSPYAKSKILAEQWLQNWAAENNVVLGILRLPLVAGQNPPGNLGAMIAAIKSGKYLSIGKASARKSIVWAEDIASIIPELSSVGGIYNLTDSYHPSLSELEKCISSSFKKAPPFKISARLATILGYIGDLLGSRAPINTGKIKKLTATLTFDDWKARDILGWKPVKVLEKLSAVL
jgi:nucleoside-diphosphate-sugar epimerase